MVFRPDLRPIPKLPDLHQLGVLLKHYFNLVFSSPDQRGGYMVKNMGDEFITMEEICDALEAELVQTRLAIANLNGRMDAIERRHNQAEREAGR